MFIARLANLFRASVLKERKKTDNPREGWEDGTPPPHRDFKERCVVRYPSPTLGPVVREGCIFARPRAALIGRPLLLREL